MVEIPKDQAGKLANEKDRTDQVAELQANMLERTLEQHGKDMDATTKSQFLTDMLSARGQVQSSKDRAVRERRLGKGPAERE